ncbi:hypothetical protein A2V94_04735 [Candidatus Atribacteria bacterium RBG_16_35_8]|nr:MAG: hypothetical protein A2V94_04735 [Candidatus Atribacteria bacterium RBG_16_35_8]
MALIFIAQYFVSSLNFFNEIWFPFYIFLVLLLFSASTLYFNKKGPDLVSREGNIDLSKRNKNLGLAVLIGGYLTLVFWLLTILLSVEIGLGWESYIAMGFFGLLMIASGILFLLSLVFNIIESRENKRMSRGLIFTIVSFPPIAFCYMAIFIKALTEGH